VIAVSLALLTGGVSLVDGLYGRPLCAARDSVLPLMIRHGRRDDYLRDSSPAQYRRNRINSLRPDVHIKDRGIDLTPLRPIPLLDAFPAAKGTAHGPPSLPNEDAYFTQGD